MPDCGETRSIQPGQPIGNWGGKMRIMTSKIPTKPKVAPIRVRKPSKAELDLKRILTKDVRTGAHAFCIAHIVGVYPA